MSDTPHPADPADVHDAATTIRHTISMLRASGIPDTALLACLAHAAGQVVQKFAAPARAAVATEAARQLLRAALV